MIINDRSKPRVPVHPGEILRDLFVAPLKLSSRTLADALGVSAPTVGDILRERRGITAEMALRLSRYFGTTPDLWLNLQKAYELDLARRESGSAIAKAVRPRPGIKAAA